MEIPLQYIEINIKVMAHPKNKNTCLSSCVPVEPFIHFDCFMVRCLVLEISAVEMSAPPPKEALNGQKS